MRKNNPYLRVLNEKEYFSQAGQDLFVLEMLNYKRSGFYCEVGGNHPFDSNNTYLLEKDYEWTGFSIEFEDELVKKFNKERKNICINSDATTFNYLEYFKLNSYPSQIVYLSLDIDPAENTYKALKQIPFEDYRFSVITYEHDNYSSGAKYMNLSREYLYEKGYKMVIGNIKIFGRDFEDWYIDPNIISKNVWSKFESNNLEFSEVFKNIL